ncbi:MAG: RNA polymerase subunit sigma [Myxococcales bacterium]|nr:RNA polymerase subunit sigma [Myxococcales bacterium]
MTLERALADAERVVVVTGAGVSLASGIPTFRGTDPDAVWAKATVEHGTYRFFREDPVASWRWYIDRFSSLLEAEPSSAHRALAALERWAVERGGSFLLVTQNVDRLHALAGSQALVEIHGRADRIRCARRGCDNGEPRGSLPRGRSLDAFASAPSIETLPRCTACGDLLRPHVLWFDERYDAHRDYQYQRVMKATKRAEAIVFVGTSFAVGITDAILSRGVRNRASLFSIDPSGRQPHRLVEPVRARAEEVLPALVQALGAQPPSVATPIDER